MPLKSQKHPARGASATITGNGIDATNTAEAAETQGKNCVTQPGFVWSTTPSVRPVCPGWAYTRTSWAPIPPISRARWCWLLAELVPEQARKGCVFVLSLCETITEMGAREYWIEQDWAIGDLSVEQAYALPVEGWA